MSLAPDVGLVEYANAVITPFAIRRIGANKRAIKGACQVFCVGLPDLKVKGKPRSGLGTPQTSG